MPSGLEARVQAPKRPPSPTPGRLIVVSHRLPVVVDLAGAAPTVRRTVGGLVSGVEAFLRARGSESAAPVWIGWPGPAAGAEQKASLADALAREPGIVPVFLEPGVHERFYDGFSNRALWPLCHTFPRLVHLDGREWQAYRAVNAAFRDAILPVIRPGDVVWVHDYQLMLLPALLRERSPDLEVAYFHHIPFPSLDVLRVLPDPWSRELLAGLMGADVVGFHTYDDVRKTLRAVEHLLDADHAGGAITREGRVTRIDAFPIGVDFARWDAVAEEPDVQPELALLRGPLEGKRVVLSVDRLDYTKGVLNRLLAFESFLEKHAEWRGRVTLVAIVVPSRLGVEAYRTMRTQIEEAVGRVNGRYGDLTWTPVLYRYRGLDRAPLAALYLRADVALVTPLRDGMNLVAKEFLASRRDQDGVLVLSDTAGAARELGEAVLVNPFHVDGMADALLRALEMPEGERRRRCAHMRERLERYDVVRWGNEQLDRLREARAQTEALRARRLPARERARLVEDWRAAKRRLLILDYDGTLVPFARDPAAAALDRPLKALLERLGRPWSTKVVVVSGRDARTLGTWFAGLPVELVAEHGARVRTPDGSWTGSPGLAPAVRARALEVMQVFADRLPGAFVEAKELSLAWHWRSADPMIGAARARELLDAIANLGFGPDTQVVVGKKVVEVRESSAHKGTAARRWEAEGPWDVVVAAGDDETDEDLFQGLRPEAWSLRVGWGESRAKWNLADVTELRGLLGQLAEAADATA
jgi:trehalose 6-phosphate synthase/phosphatase